MKLKMRAGMLLVAVLSGCATMQPDTGSEASAKAEPPDSEPVAASPVQVWLEGPGVGPGKCSTDWNYLYQRTTPAHVLLADTELYSLDTGKFVSSTTGLRITVPASESTATVMGEMATLVGPTINIPCDSLRAEFVVRECLEGECPDYTNYSYPYGEEGFVNVLIRGQ